MLKNMGPAPLPRLIIRPQFGSMYGRTLSLTRRGPRVLVSSIAAGEVAVLIPIPALLTTAYSFLSGPSVLLRD